MLTVAATPSSDRRVRPTCWAFTLNGSFSTAVQIAWVSRVVESDRFGIEAALVPTRRVRSPQNGWSAKNGTTTLETLTGL
ncbi:MAG: hypothetical protein AAGD25_16830 [Cyanobacteria bacterium P01_F01_bin.150]